MDIPGLCVFASLARTWKKYIHILERNRRAIVPLEYFQQMEQLDNRTVSHESLSD
jgi:hypothetical protein